MFDKFYLWVGKKSLSLFVGALVITCLVTIFQLIDITRKPPTLKNFGDAAVQNHLVWDIKGRCYFIRPATDETAYLVAVQDCNKN